VKCIEGKEHIAHFRIQNMKENKCYHCGSSSHRAKSCPKAKCRICSQIGHDVGGCPDKPLPLVAQFNPKAVSNSTNNTSSFSYIELFAGIGGFRVALSRLGGRCVFASEVNRFCVQNYKLNFGDQPAGDICQIPTDQIPNHDLLVGGFPCQPFSSSGSQSGMNDPQGRGVLFREIIRILYGKQPRSFLLENVRGLYLHEGGETLKLIVKELENCGYSVKYELIDAIKLLPQERCRLFFVGIRKDLNLSKEFKFPFIPHLNRGVQDILHGPNEISNLEVEKLSLNTNQLNKVKSQPYTIKHPQARFLTDPTVATKTIQSSYTRYMVGSQFVPVIFGQDNKWRRFSSREVARLQGFPEEPFHLCEKRAYHMIGNAVAPPLIAMIVATLLQYVKNAGKHNNDEGWGWEITRSLLLDAMPHDGNRKETFRILLEKVDAKN